MDKVEELLSSVFCSWEAGVCIGYLTITMTIYASMASSRVK